MSGERTSAQPAEGARLSNQRRWYLGGTLFACGLGAEAVWGAVRFQGRWYLVYGAVAVVAFGLAATIWRARQRATKDFQVVGRGGSS